jgi:hypothetical protein
VPETRKGKTVLSAMEAEYGKPEGRRIFYGSINKGTISGTGTNTERRKKQRAGWKYSK